MSKLEDLLKNRLEEIEWSGSRKHLSQQRKRRYSKSWRSKKREEELKQNIMRTWEPSYNKKSLKKN